MYKLADVFSEAGAAIESASKATLSHLADGLSLVVHKLDDIGNAFRNACRNEPVSAVNSSIASDLAAKNSRHFSPKPFEI